MEVKLLHFDVLESTNLTALKAAQNAATEGTIIIADRQSNGRGRQKRSFVSPHGGLWFSLILRPQVNPEFVSQLTLLAGVAVAHALRSLYETNKIKIKWPNDVLWGKKKICGILSEAALDLNGNVDYVVIGIGINVAPAMEAFPTEVREIATSLQLASGREFSCASVLERFIEQFFHLYSKWLSEGANSFLTEWRHMNCTLGRKVCVKDNNQVIFIGKAERIDERGAIIIRSADGNEKSFDFGEISLR